MARFLLDTNICILFMRRVEPVASRVLSAAPSELCISAVTASELRYTAARRRSKRIDRDLDAFLSAMRVEPYTLDVAHTHGRIASALRRRGKPIGDVDTFIAAHAHALDPRATTGSG